MTIQPTHSPGRRDDSIMQPVMKCLLLLFAILMLALTPRPASGQEQISQFENIMPNYGNVVFNVVNEPFTGAKRANITLSTSSNYVIGFALSGEDNLIGIAQVQLTDYSNWGSSVNRFTFTKGYRYQVITVGGMSHHDCFVYFTIEEETDVTHYNLTIWEGAPMISHYGYVVVQNVTVYETITEYRTTTVVREHPISLLGDPNLWMPLLGLEIIIAAFVIRAGSQRRKSI